jgi:hypothetical protein
MLSLDEGKFVIRNFVYPEVQFVIVVVFPFIFYNFLYTIYVVVGTRGMNGLDLKNISFLRYTRDSHLTFQSYI